MDRSFRLLAVENLTQQLSILEQQLPEILHGDAADPLHQTRVTSRRLRAGLRLCRELFPGKSYKKWRKELKAITEHYGLARDLDVQIRFVQRFSDDVTEKLYRPGLDRLLLRLEQSRRGLCPEISQFTEAMMQSVVLKSMAAAFEQLAFELKQEPDLPVSEATKDKAVNDITGAFDKMMVLEGCLGHSEQTQELHQLRIAAKRLRYTCEFYRTGFSGLKPLIKVLKKIQSRLGHIHDGDVWTRLLTQFLDEEYGRTVAYFGHSRAFSRIKPGIEFLHHHQRRQRETLFMEFISFWNEFRQAYPREQLRGLLINNSQQDLS